jgi:hypothetical protein
MKIFYVIGYPGAGKSALMHTVFKDTKSFLNTDPFAHTWHFATADSIPIAELGRMRAGGMCGTDALAMNAITKVEGWLDAMRGTVKYLVGEGDRLANDRFFEFCEGLGDLTVAMIDVPPAEAKRRATARGSKQDATWFKGRVTKVDKLAERWVTPEWHLDGMATLTQLAAHVGQHPVFEPLKVPSVSVTNEITIS